MPQASKDLIVVVAKVVVATALGGPAGGLQSAADVVVERVGARLKGNAEKPYHEALNRVSAGLRAWAEGENIPERSLTTGLAAAVDVLAANGPQSDRIAELGMDARRVAEEALGLGRAQLADLDEAERQVCRRAVTTAYDVLLADPGLLPDLDRAFQQSVLRGLESIARATAPQGRLPALTLPVRAWSAAVHPPSALLRPEYRVIPFEGRVGESDDLVTWCGEPVALAVRLYTGAGGMGKTRLLIELCRALGTQGWMTGFLDPAADAVATDWGAWLGADAAPTLMVVDYAETRQATLTALLTAAARRPAGTRLRVVLLARGVADWWHALCRTRGVVGDLLTGPATSRRRLAPLVADPRERGDVVRRASRRFATVLSPDSAGPDSAGPEGAFDEDHFERVLFLHLAALDAVLGAGTGHGSQSLLEAALSRERGLWDEMMRAAGHPAIAGRPIWQAAAVATLAGRVEGPAQALALLRHCPLLADQPAAVLDDVAEALHSLYPGESWLEGVQPDLLGEHLVGRAVEEDPELLRVFDAAQ